MTNAQCRSAASYSHSSLVVLALLCGGCGPSSSEQGKAALERKDFDQAVVSFNDAIDKHPEDVTAWASRGVAHFSKGDYEKAVADYSEAIRLDASQASLYLQRAAAYRHQREHRRAIDDCSEAIKLAPDTADCYTSRGIAYHESGQYEPAIADYTEALKRGAKDASAYANRGIAYHENGDYDKALADFAEAIRLKPTDAGNYNNRALSYRKKGEYAKAIADYESAIKQDRGSAFAYAGLAWIRATCPDPKLRNGPQAIVYGQKSCELTGWNQPFCLNALAAAYAEGERFEQAVRWQEKACRYQEGVPRAEQEKAQLRLRLYRANLPYRDP
jgi:tetratricopeptide (TPR) repeat protein